MVFRRGFAILAFLIAAAAGQESPEPAGNDTAASGGAVAPDAENGPERWNLFYQATSIGQYHGTFRSPYAGANSLQDYPERDVSLTTTLFSGCGWIRILSSTSTLRSRAGIQQRDRNR